MKSTAISRSFFVFLLSLFTLMVSSTPAGAQTAPATSYAFTVNTTADTHDAQPGDGVCADSMGQCSLRAAIEEADALPAGSSITITVPTGTYKLILGTLRFTAASITINGAGSTTTIIQGDNTFGIIYIARQMAASISQVTITGGNAETGGGIENDHGALTVSNSIVSGNHADVGGGIVNFGTGGPFIVTNSTVSNNSAKRDGGGIWSLFARVSISGSTVSGNQSNYGGGGIEDTHGPLILSNSTIVNNTVLQSVKLSSGGIFLNAGKVSISDSTLSDNSANGAGGDLTIEYSHVTITGTIVANSPSGPNCSSTHGVIKDKGYNLDSGSSCGFSLSSDLTNTDPMLGPLGDNGGPTLTMALLQSSKAIDWVATSSCPATDQRGYTRPDGSGESMCDIGAYESAY